MSLQTYLENIPKVELGLRFEGCIPKATLIMMAELNEKHREKGYDKLIAQWEDFDLDAYYEHVPTFMSWIVYPDDLTRCVYDTAVGLSKHNIRYAEIGINPLLYMQSGMSFEQLASAISDGSDRAKRGWNIDLRWVLTIPFDEPRKADEILRWTNSATGRKNGVVGIGLVGGNSEESVEQFERAFRNAEKKLLGSVAYLGRNQETAFIKNVVDYLNPDRIVGGESLHNEVESLTSVINNQTLLVINPAHELLDGNIAELDEFPVGEYREKGVNFTYTIGDTTTHTVDTSDYYDMLVSKFDYTVDAIDSLILNALSQSFLPEEELEEVRSAVAKELSELKQVHLQAENTEN